MFQVKSTCATSSYRYAHRDDGGDEVHRAHNGAETAQTQTKDPEVSTQSGVKVWLESGAYANHPNDAAPCGVRKPATAISEPKLKNQKANAFKRGNATSGAPNLQWHQHIRKTREQRVANIRSMIVPCMVKSWLYCSFGATISRPGQTVGHG